MPKRRKRRDLRHDQFHPDIAKGLTFDVPKEEALKMHPVKKAPGGAALVAHMKDADKRTFARDGQAPYAPFVARNATDAVWSDGVTGRLQMDYSKTYTPDGLRLLREGRQCLRCDEPHPEPFPVACDLCGYAMKERQIMDIAMEFEGGRHLGPSKPISQYLAEQDRRNVP